MSLIPGRSRRDLYYRLSAKKDSFLMVISDVHGEILEKVHPEIMRKSNTGFRDAIQPRTCCAYFRGLSQGDLDTLKAFHTAWEEYVVLGRTDIVREHFRDELHFCMALGMRARRPLGERSRIGKMVYAAKYDRDIPSIKSLASELYAALYYVSAVCESSNVTIVSIPAGPDKEFDLPWQLVRGMRRIHEREKDTHRRIQFSRVRMREKQSQIKNVSVEARLDHLRRLFSDENLEMEAPVTGRSVLIVDDICQSGTTMWAFARYLKDHGATRVAGLVCEKTLRNTDNL